MTTPTNLTVLNYPIETEEAKRFWASKHKCNKAKAIVAFSKDLKNANWNLTQYGYTNSWRAKVLAHYGSFVNQPSMTGIPFTPLSIPWWECLPNVPPGFPGLPSPQSDAAWDDLKRWVDSQNWGQK